MTYLLFIKKDPLGHPSVTCVSVSRLRVHYVAGATFLPEVTHL